MATDFKSSSESSTAQKSTRMTRYWRRADTPRAWWPWGLIPVLGLAALFLFGTLIMAPNIQAEVRQSVGEELGRAGAVVGSIEADGQNVTASVAFEGPAKGLLEAVAETTKCNTWAGALRCPAVVTVQRDAAKEVAMGEAATDAAPAIAKQQPEQIDAVPAAAPIGAAGEVGVVHGSMTLASSTDSCNEAFSQALSGTTVRFRTSSADIDAGSEALLAELADLAKSCPGNLTIAGHTDSRGDADMNRALSQARAEAVRDAFTSYGVASSRMAAVGYGEEQPVADNALVEGRATNRRIVISVDASE